MGGGSMGLGISISAAPWRPWRACRACRSVPVTRPGSTGFGSANSVHFTAHSCPMSGGGGGVEPPSATKASAVALNCINPDTNHPFAL